MNPSTEIQKAVRARLIAISAITNLVPATNIFDSHGRPEKFPCLILGEGQTLLERVTYNRRYIRVMHGLHCWTEGTDLFDVKTIADLAMNAINASLPNITDFVVLEFVATGFRTLRDPSGIHGHAVLDIETLVKDVS